MFADSTKIRAALRLEIVTIVWMVIEAAVAVGAGIAARSQLLVGGLISSTALTLFILPMLYQTFELRSADGFIQT